MKNTENINTMISFITECADLEGTELGEAWILMLKLYRCRDYINKKLQTALEKEIVVTYEYLKENAIIKETSEAVTRTIKTIRFKDYFG